MARAVHLVTPVPGPRSQEILSRRQQAVPRGLATNLPVVIASAHGARLTDVDGNVYVDFAGGVGCLNVGSTNAEVVEAIRAQAGRYIHGAAALAMYEEYVCVAEAVARISPLSGSKRALLVNSGSEAIENAVKIARRFTDRPAIVTFRNAFHGRTLLTMSLSANVNQKRGFGPFAPEIYRADYPYPYRSPHDSEDACGEAAFAEFYEYCRRRGRPIPGCCGGVRSHSGRGWFHRAAGKLRARNSRLLHATRHHARRRRNPVGPVPDRPDVRL